MSVKKILALLLAAMMVFGMTSALAADGQPTAQTVTIPVRKTINFFNEDTVSVYEPNITYTYTVTAADPNGATITESDANGGSTVAVKAGIMDAVTNSEKKFTIAFASTNAAVENVDPNGVALSRKGEITFNTGAFPSAGVYRYVITETVEGTTREACGVTDGTDNSVRYLDLYVYNDGTAAPVIHTEGEDGTIDPTTDGKTEGFGDKPGTDPTDTTGDETVVLNVDDTTIDDTADSYHTYNMKVTKTTTGTMADLGHKFPFSIDFANSINGAKYSTTIKDTATGTDVAGTANVGTTTTVSSALANGGSIYVYGLPTATTALTAAITETNDTEDVYKVSVTFDGGEQQFTVAGTTSAAEKSVEKETGTAVTSAVDLTAATGTPKNVFAFTNTLDDVSPTGVVLRFAPYFAMFAAGCVLFLLLATKRSKKEEE